MPSTMPNRQNILPVILCGGSGTRLWPLSRQAYPKQFHPLVGDRSLFENTLLRATAVASENRLMLLCNESQRFLASAQARNVCDAQLCTILEPIARNTAAALAAAALVARKEGHDPILVALPSDHHITDISYFCQKVEQAAQMAKSGYLVTFGIKPTAPETGYGYIEQTEQAIEQGFKVKAFTEKPDLAKAQQFVAGGKHTWNSGMFVFRASVFLTALEKLAPEVFKSVTSAVERAKTDLDFVRLDAASFAQAPSISVDYAVFERSDNVAVIPYEGDWSDLGSWDAVAALANQQKTAALATQAAHSRSTHAVASINAQNNHVVADKPVALVGVDDLVVVDTVDALLVVHRHAAQQVKEALSELVKTSPELAELGESHRKVYRPWGWYDSIDAGERFKVKRICVNPGATLSLQKHHHRAEHWVVVKGTAHIINGDKALSLTENQSTYIPVGEVHRLHNPGRQPLEIIEVQTGGYLGEDDIVRLEDAYGRHET